MLKSYAVAATGEVVAIGAASQRVVGLVQVTNLANDAITLRTGGASGDIVIEVEALAAAGQGTVVHPLPESAQPSIGGGGHDLHCSAISGSWRVVCEIYS